MPDNDCVSFLLRAAIRVIESGPEPTMPQPHLPPEVIDNILSLLRDDHSSLRCCSVVNKVLLDLVERHLYHQITLHHSDSHNETTSTSRIDQLKRQLTTSPSRGSYVKVLRISFSVRMPGKGGLRSSVSPDVIIVGEILRLFSNISTISLTVRSRISWVDLDMSFQQSFTEMLVQNPITSISITRVSKFPLPLLNHCKRLVDLSLVQLRVPSPIIQGLPAQSLHSNKRAQIESLYIDWDEQASPILTWLESQNSPKIQRLSSLRLSVPYFEQAERLQALLEHSSSHLKDVHLDVSEITYITGEMASTPSGPTLNLYDFRAIRFLTLSGKIEPMDIVLHGVIQCTMVTSIPWFVHLLQTFGSPQDPPTNLERMTFEISFLTYGHVASFADVDWQPLAAILTSGSFISLHEVEMRVISGLDAIESVALIAMLRSNDHLLPLIQSGFLSIIECPSRELE